MNTIQKSPQAENFVYVFEASHLADEDALLLHSAQGLLNRDRPLLWLDYKKELGFLSPVRAEQWVDGVEVLLRDYFSKKFHLNFQALDSLDEVLSKARDICSQYILIDPDVPETQNIANTLSGIHGALMAFPQHRERVEALGFTCVEDLTGRFLGWTKEAIAAWSFETLFPQCDRKAVLFRTVHDVRTFDVTERLNEGHLDLRIQSLHEDPFKHPAELRYAALRTRRGETLAVIDRRHIAQAHYVTGGMVEKDDRQLPAVSEYRLQADTDEELFLVLQVTGVFRVEILRRDGAVETLTEQVHPPSYGQSLSYTLEFSPFMRDFATARNLFCVDLSSSEQTPEQREVKTRILESISPNGQVLGWHSTYGGEHDHVLHVSRTGNTVMCALSAHNFSFLQHLKDSDTLRFPPAPPPPALNRDKIYLGFIVGDGDASGICYHLMRGMLLEEGRGRVPLGMSLQLLLQDYAPGLLHYYIDHITDQDAVFAGCSGAGYAFAECMSPDHLEAHTAWSAQWVKSLRPHGLYYLSNPINFGGAGVNPAQRESFARHLAAWIPGVIDGYMKYGEEPNGEDSMHDGFIWAQTRAPDVGTENDWSVMDPEGLFQQLQSFAHRKQPGVPMFIPVHPWIDKHIGPDQVLEWSKQLGNEFEIVRPDHLLLLMKEWMEIMKL